VWDHTHYQSRFLHHFEKKLELLLLQAMNVLMLTYQAKNFETSQSLTWTLIC